MKIGLVLWLIPLLVVAFVLIPKVPYAQEPDFVVSPAGSDTGPGSESRPFASIQRSILAARELRKASPGRAKPIVVELKGGLYRLDRAVELVPEDSGTAESPTVFRAAAGEVPILSGARRVIGWRAGPDGLWRAPTPIGQADLTQLFVNGRRAQRPSWPHDGHLWIHDGIAGTRPERRDRFIAEPEEFPVWADWEGVEAVITHNWGITRGRIRSFEPESGTVTLAASTWHESFAALRPGTWFRLDNTPLRTIRPGEWRQLPGNGVPTLVYKPLPGENPDTLQAEAPALEVLLQIGRGTPGPKVQHIRFEGIVFEGATWVLPEDGLSNYQAELSFGGAVIVSGAEAIAFRNITVRRVGGYGFQVGEYTRNIILEDSKLYDLGAGGVRIGGLTLDPETDLSRYPDGIQVQRCVIAHGGRVHPAGIGVWISHARNCKIENNRIYDFYYSGISVGWVWGDSFSPSKGNSIKGNRIHDLGHGVLSDMGGIYTLGVSEGTVIAQNLIYNVRSARYGGWGIYYDEGSAHIVVEDNIAHHTHDSPFHIHYGRDNTVRHNVFAYGTLAQLQFSNMARTGRIRLEQNLIRWNEGRLFASDPDDEIIFVDNTYWRESDPQGILFAGGLTVESWRAREPGLRIADVGFDPAKPWTPAGPGQPGPRVTPATQAPAMINVSPAVPHTFPPAPAVRPVIIRQGFENLAANQQVPGWTTMSPDASLVAVTDETAATGKHSLRVTDSDQGEPWMPHLYASLTYPLGTVVTSFALRVEPGAQPSFEWRDVDPWYTTGPMMSVRADGAMMVADEEIARIPSGQWVQIHVEADLGPNSPRVWMIKIEGLASPVQRTFPLPERFKKIGWVGFTTVGAAATVYYLDDLTVLPPGVR